MGPSKVPFLTPVNAWTMCSWQVEGQWWRTSSHWKAEAGSAPLWASVPVPENAMLSPTAQVVAAVGAVIVATGAVLPTVITIEAMSVAPLVSVTRSLTVTCPFCV